MVNLPINICHCPGNFPSSSKVIYSQFFHKWKFQKISSGQRQFRFIYPTGSFAKSQETFCEQLRNTHEIIQTKTDSLPQIFALDLYKAIMTALTKSFCIKLKNCPSKSGIDYQGVLKSKVSVPASIFWTIWPQFPPPHRKLCRILKRFWSANFEELTLFFQKVFLKAFWRLRIQLWQSWRKKFAKSWVFLLKVPNWL